MFLPEAFEAALVESGEVADVTKIEFEILDSGLPRWLVWSGPKLLHSCTLDRAELLAALQMTASLLRMMTLAREAAGPNLN